MSKCGFATLLIPLGVRTTYVVGLGALLVLTGKQDARRGSADETQRDEDAGYPVAPASARLHTLRQRPGALHSL